MKLATALFFISLPAFGLTCVSDETSRPLYTADVVEATGELTIAIDGKKVVEHQTSVQTTDDTGSTNYTVGAMNLKATDETPFNPIADADATGFTYDTKWILRVAKSDVQMICTRHTSFY